MNRKDKHKLYDSPHAFRQAVEDRLRKISISKNVPLDRLRKRIAFDRLLARIFSTETKEKPHWLLKGGYALEIRFAEIARTTKDIDIAIPAMQGPSPDSVHEMLRLSAEKYLGDWFEFRIGAFTHDLHQPIYGGWRYPVEARLATRKFAMFHIDVAVGDAVIANPEWQRGSDILSFAGIDPPLIALYPKAQHFAEKIHSLTFPREKREMSRVRDLVDLVLLIESSLPDKDEIVKAIEATFKRRKTHDVPQTLVVLPDFWQEPYVEIARDCGVECKTVQEAFKLLTEFWESLYKKER